MSKSLWLVLFLSTLGCTKESNKSDKGGHETPSELKPPKEAGPGNTSIEGTTPSGQLIVQLSLDGGQAVAGFSFANVAPSFKKCLPCHDSGRQAPNLATFPFKSGTDGLGIVMTKIAHRINDAQNPMPPTGLLGQPERQMMNEWIQAGYPELPPPPPASAELEQYSIDLSWKSGSVESPWTHLNGMPNGQFIQSLGTLGTGAKLSVMLKVTRADGVVVLEQTFQELTLSTSGSLLIPVRIVPVAALAPTPSPELSPSPSPEATPEPQVVAAQLAFQLSLTQEGSAVAPPSYPDVREQFQACMPCHASGHNAPTLSSFPFRSPNDSLSTIMRKIRLRTGDSQNPMPPTGLLPLAARQSLNAWIDAGYLELPPPPLASAELAQYSLDIAWDFGAGETPWTHMAGLANGQFMQALGNVPVGTALSIKVKVYGPRQSVVLEKSFSSLVVPASGTITLPLSAVHRDSIPPIPGDRGRINGSNITEDSARLNWTAAADAVSPQANLSYRVFSATTDTLSTVADILRTGTLIAGPASDLTTITAKDLSPGTAYYFNVIVTDEAENTTAYASLMLTTTIPPSPDQYPNCNGLTTPQAIAAWRVGAATALASESVDDSVVAEQIARCFPASTPSCLKPTQDYAMRNDTAGAELDVPIARSPHKLPPKEFLVPGANGLEYTIPVDIERIAAEKGWPAVRYKSRHAGGFDPMTPNLLMVYVPGDKMNPPVSFDRWLNFPLPQDNEEHALTPLPQVPVPNPEDYTGPGGVGLPSTFTLVTLEKATPTKPAEVYFQMFFRSRGTPKFIPGANSALASCISCHPNGLRAISPLGFHVRADEDQLPERDWKTVKIINDAMISAAGDKPVSWRSAKVQTATGPVRRSFFNPEAQGPSVGPVVPLNSKNTRSQSFIMGGTRTDGTPISGCYKTRPTVEVVDIFGRAPGRNNIYTLSDRPNIRWTKVRDAMKCSGCHNNVQRGALNIKTAAAQIDYKILVDQSMPLGAHTNPLDPESRDPGLVRDGLTGDERIALANCLAAEFEIEQGELLKWLTKNRCE